MRETCTAVYETAGGPGEALQAWSGFRTVGNLKFPFHSVTCRDVVKFSEHGVQSIKRNPRLDPVISFLTSLSSSPRKGAVRTT